ncbi:MAG: SH3 domain-containing protein [Betaproteobacteria bacterium]|nr:SH3 domain-containing protein [Betaproteobacteria bacterium]
MKKLLAAAAALACVIPASAAEGVVVVRNPATIYDAPAANGRPLYVLSLDYPLIVLSRTSTWLTVCMHDRSVGYISTRDVKAGNAAMVLRRTQVRTSASAGAAVAFTADAGLLLSVDGPAAGDWLPVRHGSGRKGYINRGDLFSAAAGSSC